MKKLNFILVTTMCLAFIGCGGNAGNTNTASATNGRSSNATNTEKPPSDPPATGEYPQSVKDEFLKSCVGAGSKPEFCSCVFDKVQSKYTFEEFSVIESKMSAGDTPPEFVEFSGKARAECTKR